MRKYILLFISILTFTAISLAAFSQNKIIVFQSDFGLKDGAVAAMKGVAMGFSPDLKLFDLTHEIPAYNIWEAAYRLEQTVAYWPKGTVFVSVVDPGVGSNRKSVVLKTNAGHYIVTPDNGTLTLVAASQGITAVREIDEAQHRRAGSENSHTFHGRDVYAYTAAKLASGNIRFEQVGKLLPAEVVIIPFQKASLEGMKIKGTIDVLDSQYGNIWTNIPATLFNQLKVSTGDTLRVTIYHLGKKIYEGLMPYSTTFAAVPQGKPLLYLNSLMQVSFALNQGNFSTEYQVYSGNEWQAEIEKKEK